MEELTCIDCNKSGPDVRPTTTPDRRDFKTFDRCPDCFDERLTQAIRTMNRYPEAFMGGCPFNDDSWGAW
tara:strand:- start:205 stop:414 length:210 start_codon:yes stop_codon:yes gene_type:complete